jgi:aspartyl/asparaginyl beta-hydroxylase
VPPEARGARGYTQQLARVHYSSLIDAWMLGGREEAARECAALAVRQGMWEHPMQRAKDYIAGLTARPLHDPAGFWFTGYLEERFPQIRDEILGVLDTPSDPVRPTLEDGWLTRQGDWLQAHLFRDGQWQRDVCARFPVTTGILSEIPEVTTLSPGVIMISRLTPGTRIMAHCGSTNAVLRVHLPVRVPPGVSIRVADEVLTWTEGRCLIFDDSFEHEVWHEGTQDRIVLIVDMPHPDLSDSQRDGLLRRRPGPEEFITAFMRDRGIAGITSAGGVLAFRPDGPTGSMLGMYLDGAGITAADLRDGRVAWERRDGPPADGG